MNEPTDSMSAAKLVQRFGHLWARGIAEQDRRDPAAAAKAAGANDIQEWVKRHRP